MGLSGAYSINNFSFNEGKNRGRAFAHLEGAGSLLQTGGSPPVSDPVCKRGIAYPSASCVGTLLSPPKPPAQVRVRTPPKVVIDPGVPGGPLYSQPPSYDYSSTSSSSCKDSLLERLRGGSDSLLPNSDTHTAQGNVVALVRTGERRERRGRRRRERQHRRCCSAQSSH